MEDKTTQLFSTCQVINIKPLGLIISFIKLNIACIVKNLKNRPNSMLLS